MKTRAHKAINTSKTKRIPLSDKTNNVKASSNMKRKNNTKKTENQPVKPTVKQTKSTRIKNAKNVATPVLSENKTTRNTRSKTPVVTDPSTKTTQTRNTRSKTPVVTDPSTKTTQTRNTGSKNAKDDKKSNKSRNDSNTETKTIQTRVSRSKIAKNVAPVLTEGKKLDTSQTRNSRTKVATTPILNDSKNDSITTKPIEHHLKRLLDISPENNSDPYEFKFDPKEEPKRKPKKRPKHKKYDTTTDTSDEEDNSMKPIVKKIRKKQKVLPLTPFERNLRNRIVKPNTPEIFPQKPPEMAPDICPEIPVLCPEICPIVPEITTTKSPSRIIPVKPNKPQIPPKNPAKPAPKTIAVTSQIPPKKTAKPAPKTMTTKSPLKTIATTSQIPPKPPAKPCPQIPETITTPNPPQNTSIRDEINEIVDTFLEDESISSPSRIDIISNLIARKRPAPTSVFNSTMIQETPQNCPPRSPWRVEVSGIPKPSLNFSVKNKSFTPSYVPDYITPDSIKKQTTLLGFVNRAPKTTNLQVSLFSDAVSPPPRKPFGNLSNSMSPIRPTINNRTDNSLFGFTVLSDSTEDKENSPVQPKKKSPKIKKLSPVKVKTVPKDPEPKINDTTADNTPNPLFEDLVDDKVKRNEKRYSRQYTRPQTKRKRNVSFKIDSDVDDSDSDVELPVKKKQKDVLTKEEAAEAERLASHYNSYFEEIENYPLCIE